MCNSRNTDFYSSWNVLATVGSEQLVEDILEDIKATADSRIMSIVLLGLILISDTFGAVANLTNALHTIVNYQKFAQSRTLES